MEQHDSLAPKNCLLPRGVSYGMPNKFSRRIIITSKNNSKSKTTPSNPGVSAILSSTTISSKEATMYTQSLPCRKGGPERIVQRQRIYIGKWDYAS